MVHSFLCVYPGWGSLSFLVQWIYIFHQIWKIPASISANVLIAQSLFFLLLRLYLHMC